MTPVSGTTLVAVAFAGLAAFSAYDLQNVSRHTLVVYTTAALRDLLESEIIPRYEAQGGPHVQPVYTAAGEQYNRLRMSGHEPEVDVFLHASPLFIEKGMDDGYFRTSDLTANLSLDASFESRRLEGGPYWSAFAWTPLVEIYAPSFEAPPDLARDDVRFGFPHPRLSNSGVYNTIVFEAVDPDVGAKVLDETVVQPVNARTTVTGVADGSYEATLGYEAVAAGFAAQGAEVKWGPVRVDGTNLTTPVLCVAALVKGPRNVAAEAFVRLLFTPAVQEAVAAHGFRSVLDAGRRSPPPEMGHGVDVVRYDWSQWRGLDQALTKYEVKSGGYT